jgi:hypothetical protein
LNFIFDRLGNIKPAENPTHYRSPRQYIDMCQSRMLSSTSEEAHEQVYELVFAKALESYYEIKNNNNQVKFENFVIWISLMNLGLFFIHKNKVTKS